MKRLFTLVLGVVVTCCLAGCNSDKDKGINKDRDKPRSGDKKAK